MADADALLTANALADSEEPRVTPNVPPSGKEDCPNCGAALRGRYCAECGQLDQPLRQPLHRFLVQSFTEFFGLDGRVWRTLGVLLFKPGSLTTAYLRGRRRHYLRPLRVYLSSTLLFFVLLSLIDPVGRMQESMFGTPDATDSVRVADRLAFANSTIAGGFEGIADERVELADLRAAMDSLTAIPAGVTDLGDDLSNTQDDLEDILDEIEDDSSRIVGQLRRARLELVILQTMPPDSIIAVDDLRAATRMIYPDDDGIVLGGGEIDRFARSDAVRRMNEAQTDREKRAGFVAFLRSAIGYVPTVMFLILPVFAFILKVLYVRRGWYYSEHLVFGLHTHAFAFLIFTFVALLAWPGGDTRALDILQLVLLCAIPLYFLIAQKRVYGQGWIRTLVKAGVLAFAYNTVLIAGLVGAVLLAAVVG